ncbi:MAG: hypothetical protein FWF84_04505 [Kiritimatiellaeota bacterium]|nr:hypothetical protein [Kiritimatiellota bacterium]
MKRTMAMMVAVAAHAVGAATWMVPGGGVLEEGGNWDPSLPAAGEAVTFGFDGSATLSTWTGFTNGATSLYATNCTVTFDIKQGAEYAMDYMNLYAVDSFTAPYACVFAGGGTVRSGGFNFSSADARLCVTEGTRVDFLGSRISLGYVTGPRIGLVLEDGATMGIGGGTIEFRMGEPTDFNTLAVRSGAVLSNALVYAGIGGNSNGVVVSNATFGTPHSFTVGYIGEGNSLHVSDGGSFACGDFTVGHAAENGWALIEGEATAFTVGGQAKIGYHGSGNFLEIVDVPTPFMGSLILGDASSGGYSVSNRVVVTGGDAMNVAGNVNVGGFGSFNTLEVSDIALGIGGNLYVGSTPVASNNTAVLSGLPAFTLGGNFAFNGVANTLRLTGGMNLNLPQQLAVDNGIQNRLEVLGGTTVATPSMYAAGTGNTLTIAEGSEVTVSGTLLLAGISNRLEVSNATLNQSGDQVRLANDGSGPGGLLRISDGASVTFDGTSCYAGTYAHDVEKVGGFRMEVVGGSTLTVKSFLTVSYDVPNVVMVVDDATVEVPNSHITLGQSGAYGVTVELRGDNPKVVANSGLNAVAPGSTFRYVFGRRAPEEPIIAVTNGTMSVSGALFLDIDAETLSKASGAKAIPLMAFASAPNWDAVTNSVTMIPEGCRLYADGGTLFLDVPGSNRTVILVR